MRIVVGYDGSGGAKRALERAIELRDGDTTIDVVAAERLTPQGKGAMLVVDPIDVTACKRALRDADARLHDAGIAGRLIEARGDPGKVLVQHATEARADLIVVGTRGHGPVGRALLGSASTAVVHHAPCDVLVVR